MALLKLTVSVQLLSVLVTHFKWVRKVSKDSFSSALFWLMHFLLGVCSSSPKKSDSFRLCVELKNQNKVICQAIPLILRYVVWFFYRLLSQHHLTWYQPFRRLSRVQLLYCLKLFIRCFHPLFIGSSPNHVVSLRKNIRFLFTSSLSCYLNFFQLCKSVRSMFFLLLLVTINISSNHTAA